MEHELIDKAWRTAHQMITDNAPVEQILLFLVNTAEQFINEDDACSILLLDEDGLLRNGASPKLPADYLKAIDRLKPNPAVGTCCVAAATGEPVFTRSFNDDDKWSELRHLPMELGYKGAWSTPIKNGNGEVLGTFGTYHRTQKHPGILEIHAIEALSKIAATALTTTKNKLVFKDYTSAS